ncbi:MAG: hypothetical protein IFK91_08880 [Acidobacteria bacterium]|nr:hypothetical protein [Candidatus Sulfomarinibacter sp. MAG AM1]
MLKLSTLLTALLLITGCATTSEPTASDPGTRQIHRNAVLHEGPELVAAVTYLQGKNSVAEERLILGVELTSPRGSGPNVVSRSDISIRTPVGRRLALISQDEFRRSFARMRIPVERTLDFLPLLYRYLPTRLPCDRWYLVSPPENIAFDEIPINSSQTCSGPLVFSVPGGVQPGRWRLVVELEESRADIPFIIEIED